MNTTTMTSDPDAPTPEIVHVVDDDDAVRRFLSGLLQSVGLEVASYASAHEFLEAGVADGGCLLLDIRMPGMSGLELQRALVERGFTAPVIFITGHGDVPIAVQAMKAGAFDFVEKPFNNNLLLDRVQKAVAASGQVRGSRSALKHLHQRRAALTQRERQVLDLVVTGQTNKGIARTLEISARTVEIHRASVMAKMNADSLAELVSMVIRLEGAATPQ